MPTGQRLIFSPSVAGLSFFLTWCVGILERMGGNIWVEAFRQTAGKKEKHWLDSWFSLRKLSKEEFERQEKEQRLSVADEKVVLAAEELKTYK